MPPMTTTAMGMLVSAPGPIASACGTAAAIVVNAVIRIASSGGAGFLQRLGYSEPPVPQLVGEFNEEY